MKKFIGGLVIIGLAVIVYSQYRKAQQETNKPNIKK